MYIILLYFQVEIFGIAHSNILMNISVDLVFIIYGVCMNACILHFVFAKLYEMNLLCDFNFIKQNEKTIKLIVVIVFPYACYK